MTRSFQRRRYSLQSIFLVVVVGAVVGSGIKTAAASEVGISRKFGLGGVLGSPTGPTIKYFFTPHHSLDAALGVGWFGGNALHIHVDYLYHFRPAGARTADFDLTVYLGAGLKFLFWFNRGCHAYWGYRCRAGDDHQIGIGIRAPFGVGFNINKVPLEVFLEFGLVFGVFPYLGAFLDGGVGVRYYF